MTVDLGPLGKIIGWGLAILIAGALVTTGLVVLVGKAARDVTTAPGDFYRGYSGGKEATLTSPGQIKIGPFTLDLGESKSLTLPGSEAGKQWGGVEGGAAPGITWEVTPAPSGQTVPSTQPTPTTQQAPAVPSGPACTVPPGVMKYSGEGVELGPVTAQEAGTRNITRWYDAKYVEVMFPNGPGVINSQDPRVTCTGTATAPSAPTTATGPSPECISARGTLKGLQGSPDPARIKAAAETVLATCADTESVSNASAALEVAVTEMAKREAEAASHQARLDAWSKLETAAAALGTNSTYYNGVKVVILAAGGQFHLEKIEGLQPGIFRSMCGGGEICTLFAHPPSDIAGEVTSITLRTELQALFDWGIGAGPSGILRKCSLPAVPADYSLGGDHND